MTDFLIKSTVTMAVLLTVYHLLLEKEKMHRFNRFYLLVSLVMSLAIPFITVITYIEYIETPVITEPFTSAPITVNEVVEQPVNYWPYFAWIAYGIISLLLLIRFIKNCSHFISKSTVNKRTSLGNATLVLMNEKTLPHTFLNYIFVNRAEYEARQIEDELYTHEYTHVKQKHTLDILFIEILRIVFWFNPLLYYYKKAIQLNHEFLADEKVIDSTANTVYYQSLLLKKATVGTAFSLASNLTFSLTKKRFIMMTKTTSTKKASLLKLAIAPVITILMMTLCTKTVAQETLNDIPREKIRTLDINKKISQRQVDSLRKANPKVYKSESPANYAETTVKFTNKKGKLINKKFFVDDTVSEKQKSTKLTSNGLSDIPSDKITLINVYKNVTQQQIDSLKKATPKTYVSNNPRDYGIISVSYTDENGNPAKKKLFVEETAQ